MLKLLPSYCFSRESIEKLMRKNNDTPKLYVASYGYMLAKKKICIFPSDTMEPGGDILFEGKPYMIMKDPDSYLKTMYGDYMKLPPMEARVPAHRHGKISFDVKAEY